MTSARPTSTFSSAQPTPTATATAQTLATAISNCGGCAVLASRRNAVGNFSAALVTVGGQRAALLSLRPEGSVVSATAVPYGATFTAPEDGLLPCDSAGRCLVIGRQPDGKAIAGAFALADDGTWTDVSISGGFRSTTSAARVVDLAGSPGIAVQRAAGAATGWQVWSWGGDGYTSAGCAPAAADPDTVTLQSCG